MKEVMKSLLYAAVVLSMSISCKKDDPTACGIGNNLICIGKLSNEKADYSGVFFHIENYGEVDVCPTCESRITDMKLKLTYTGSGTLPYKYRLWGQIYVCDDCPILGINFPKPLLVYVDRIETTN